MIKSRSRRLDRRSPSSSSDDAPRKRLRPDCRQLSGLLKQVTQSRTREDRDLRRAADAKLAKLEFPRKKD